MTPSQTATAKSESLLGVVYAASAFSIWGLSPMYWKVLKALPAMEIVMHRVVWSFLFLLPLIAVQGKWAEFVGVVKNRKMLLTLLLTAIIVGGNWLLYIWKAPLSFHPGTHAIYRPQQHVSAGGILLPRAVFQNSGRDVCHDLGSACYLFDGFAN